MSNRKQRLILEQTDQKLEPFKGLGSWNVPGEGWVYNIRKALNISLRQLAQRMKVTPQAIKALEQREKLGSLTIKSLRDAAEAMEMELVYGFVPKDGSLKELIEKKAMEVAKEIVNRTSQTMKLEDQENEKARLMNAFTAKKNELIEEIPRFLWD